MSDLAELPPPVKIDRRKGRRSPKVGNRNGTRWRGQLPVPSSAHPLVRRFFEILNEDMTVISEVAERAGLQPSCISNWRYRRNPMLPNFEAALNVLGYELKIVRRRT